MLGGYEFTRYEYDAFGNATDGGADYMVLESGHMVWSATRNNQFRYCGEYFDQETDSYYLRARYYDPALGRFISEDTHWNTDNMIYGDNPVKINERENPYNPNNSVTFAYSPNINAVLQSGNQYSYCVGNPVHYSDPDGEFFIEIVGLCVIIGSTLFLSSCGHTDLEQYAKEQRKIGNNVVFGSETKSSSKLANQMAQRGWTQEMVMGVVVSPYVTCQSINNATGNPATAYYDEDGNYVVIDDYTKEVVQVSNRNDSNWIPDKNIVNPYTPKR